MANEVRTFLTSVAGWVELLSNHPDVKSTEVVSGITLQQGMENLSRQMEELQERLEMATQYAHDYEKGRSTTGD
jgi:hypothetical protein